MKPRTPMKIVRPGMESPQRLTPFRLTTTLYPLSTALAVIVAKDSGCIASHPAIPSIIVVHDLVDLMGPEIDPGVTPAVPRVLAEPGSCGWAQPTGEADTTTGRPVYNIVSLGGTCCVESSSGSESSDESSESSDQSGSGSGSGSSGPASDASLSYESGSDKSEAIVPSKRTPDGYVGLHVVESPGVQFVDFQEYRIPQQDTKIPIDPQYIEVCHPGSLSVVGSTDVPLLGVPGYSIVGDKVRILFYEQRPEREVLVTLRFAGVRKGFFGWRFPNRTREQFLANEKTIKSAFPGAGR